MNKPKKETQYFCVVRIHILCFQRMGGVSVLHWVGTGQKNFAYVEYYNANVSHVTMLMLLLVKVNHN